MTCSFKPSQTLRISKNSLRFNKDNSPSKHTRFNENDDSDDSDDEIGDVIEVQNVRSNDIKHQDVSINNDHSCRSDDFSSLTGREGPMLSMYQEFDATVDNEDFFTSIYGGSFLTFDDTIINDDSGSLQDIHTTGYENDTNIVPVTGNDNNIDYTNYHDI